MILVVRREGKLLRRYVHLGTGNYHLVTARLYTDYGLLTCDNTIGVDVQKIFHQLTAPGRPGKLKKLLQSPFTLHRTILELIRRESRVARTGKSGRIIAKMNSLSEVQAIDALHEASCAGVKIDLIDRVETYCLIEDKRLRKRVLKEGLNNYLADNTRAWVLKSDGSYVRTRPGAVRGRDAQLSLLDNLGR